MTYTCGTLGLQRLGIADSGPRYTCDSCGAFQDCYKDDGLPYVWLINGKLPPGWTREVEKDFCKKCRLCLPLKPL